MKFPISKYRFIETKNMVIAISTYAGKTVKGIAKTNPKDEFDLEKGKALAAARCNQKVAEKRFKRASDKVCFAQKQLDEAKNYYIKMSNYYADSEKERDKANKEVKRILKEI